MINFKQLQDCIKRAAKIQSTGYPITQEQECILFLWSLIEDLDLAKFVEDYGWNKEEDPGSTLS